jgi:acyl-CoA thioesterase
MSDRAAAQANANTNAQAIADSVGEAISRHDGVAVMLGIVLEEIRPGYARVRMTVRPDMLNSHGIGHGGMTFALADTGFAYAGNSRNHVSVAQHCSITFLRATRAGDVLTAVAEERGQFGRTGIYDVTVTNQDGDVVALFRGNGRTIEGAIDTDLAKE